MIAVRKLVGGIGPGLAIICYVVFFFLAQGDISEERQTREGIKPTKAKEATVGNTTARKRRTEKCIRIVFLEHKKKKRRR